MLVNDYNAISNPRLHLINKINEMCSRYSQRKLVTDYESEKIFCSKCEFVIIKKLQEAVPE